MNKSLLPLWRWLRSYGWFALLVLGIVGTFFVAHQTKLRHQQAKFTIGYLTGYVYKPNSGEHQKVWGS